MTPKEFLIFSIALLTIYATATHSLFVTPAVANPACISVKADIADLELVLAEKGEVGKVWLWKDEKFSMTIVASPMFPAGNVILSFHDTKGCLQPHPRTGQIRTAVPVTDRIRGFIAKSKLFWSNTDKTLVHVPGNPA